MSKRSIGRYLAALLMVLSASYAAESKQIFWHVAEYVERANTNTPDSKQPPKPDERGTEATPLIVKQIPAEKSQAEAANDAQEQNDKRWNDRVTLFIAAATAVILFFQLIVFGWQARRLRQTIAAMREIASSQSRDTQASIRAAEDSASAARDSAKIAERALMELEAPFLSVKIISPGLYKRKLPPIGHDFENLEYDFINFGRTPASLVELVDKTVLISINAGLPPEVNLEFRSRNTMPRGIISPPSGESQPFTLNLMQTHMDDLAEAGANNYPLLSKKAIFFYGFLRYETIFKEQFRMGFCFEFDRYGDRWLLSGGEKYNYLVAEKRPDERAAPHGRPL